MTTTQLTFRVDQTPEERHATARRHVVQAIATAAELDHGRVSPNHVRAILGAVPEWDIPPQVVGATYRALKGSGILVADGHEVSDDVRGGNAGRMVPTYRWVGAA